MRTLIACLALSTVGCRKPEPVASPASPLLDVVVARALPAVVLLVRHQRDGTVGYGAGVLLDESGRVLTNLHVVDGGAALGGLLYDPERTTYTVLEGGLQRFLYEQQDQLIAATEVRRDPVLDLALLHLPIHTKGQASLALSDRPVKLGDQVLSIGHPGEALWSFTSGIVSALPDGMIQHDSSVSPGSSGGPLLDREGKLIGINTAMVKTTRGAAFARPAAMIQKFLDEEGVAPATDRRTPESLVRTCLRGVEWGGDADCLDPSIATPTRTTLMFLSPEEDALHLDLLGSWNNVPWGTLVYASAKRQLASNTGSLPSLVRCEQDHAALCSGPPGTLTSAARATLRTAIAGLAPASRAKLLTAAREVLERETRRLAKRGAGLTTSTGFATWSSAELRERLRGGWRIAEVKEDDHEGKELAWARVEGRDRSDRRFQFSVHLRRSRHALAVSEHAIWIDDSADPEGWYPDTPHDAAVRPAGWPLPLSDEASARADLDRVAAQLVLETAGPLAR